MADEPPATTPTPGPAGSPDDLPGGVSPTLGDFFWLGTAVAISVVGAGAIGFGLDTWLGTTPWLSFAGLAFGLVGAVLMTVNQVRRFQ